MINLLQMSLNRRRMVAGSAAGAAIAFNPETGEILWEENGQDKRPIASITKVMTALVFLENNPDLSQEITVERSDVYAASTTYLRNNDRITLDNVLHLTLIASDIAAARALARVSHGGTASFIERMNAILVVTPQPSSGPVTARVDMPCFFMRCRTCVRSRP